MIFSDKKIYGSGGFEKDKSFLGFGYEENKQSYYTSEEAAGGIPITESLKSNYEDWLKEMNIIENNLKDYLINITNQTRKPTDLQSVIHTYKSDGKMKDPNDSMYDDDFYLKSASRGIYMDGFSKIKN